MRIETKVVCKGKAGSYFDHIVTVCVHFQVHELLQYKQITTLSIKQMHTLRSLCFVMLK